MITTGVKQKVQEFLPGREIRDASGAGLPPHQCWASVPGRCMTCAPVASNEAWLDWPQPVPRHHRRNLHLA